MNQSDPSHTIRRPRQRASIACQSCNSKRVKCDAARFGVPCSNCRRTGRECKLIESRRGKKKSKAAANTTAVAAEEHNVQVVFQNTPKPDRGDATSTGAADDLGDYDNNVNSSQARDEPDRELVTGHVNRRLQEQTEGPESLHAEILEAPNTSPPHMVTNPGGPEQILNFTHLLHQRQPDQLPADAVGSRFLGATQKEKDLLQLQNVFEIPNSHVCVELFRAYFTHVAPHYPIIDRSNFIFLYAIPQRPPSWLLLQSVLFMAAGHCDEHLLKEAGFISRYDARVTLFNRAKALFDVDHEKDKFTIIQAVFLMSFWWATPTDSKDAWHWLGIAISLALKIGMHRSKKDSGMPPKAQRLWKRLWWSLYTEDKHVAASLDRPVRLRLSDCDVEPLESTDFEGEGFGFGDNFKIGLPKAIMAYPICLTSLSKILERIIETSQQTAWNRENSPDLCDGMIQVWESGLMELLQLDRPDTSDTIWPSMIHIAACWCRIIAYRGLIDEASSVPSLATTPQKAIKAAFQIIQLVEDLLTSDRIHQCPVHIIPSLFAAMGVLATMMRSGNKVSKLVAYAKFNVCTITLRQLQDLWPICGWIILLFTDIVKGIWENNDLQADQTPQSHLATSLGSGRQSEAVNNASFFETGSTSRFQSCDIEIEESSSAQIQGAVGYDTSEPAPAARVFLPKNSYAPIPLDFSIDWSGVREKDLWLNANSTLYKHFV